MKKEVHVWDIWIRLFHWTLVALILFSWLSAELGGIWMEWHTQAGSITAGLIVFRILWGLFGSWSARFATFVRGPKAVLRYLKREDNAEYLSHNPLGGWGVVALLTLITLQVLTGLFSNDDIFIEGPLAYLIDYDTSIAITGIHELIFKLLMLTIILHLAGVAFHQRVCKEKLIQAMFHGRKARKSETLLPQPSRPTALLVLALAAAIGISAWLLFGF